MTYTIEEAAARLGGPFTVDFLKNHLADLPHIRAGKGRGRAGRVAFSERQLEEIIEQFSVRPTPQPDVEFPSMASRRGRRGSSRG